MAKQFTKEEQAVLKCNPYTLNVSDHWIKYTVEFKHFLLSELAKPGVTYKAAFKKAGYDPDVLGWERIAGAVRSIRQEAASPQGLHETGPSQSERLKEDLTKKRTETAIRELQEEVVYRQQQVDFLKKTLRLTYKDTEKP